MKKNALIFLFFLTITLLKGEEKVKLSDPESFSIILLPDPQTYIKFQKNQGIFDLMTAWINYNIEDLSIKTVLCTGDLVEQNDRLIADGFNGDQSSVRQWEYVSRCFERLDNKLPYIICTGNHDYGYVSAENRTSYLKDYFQPERNYCWEKSLVSICNNAFGTPTLENAAYELKTDTWGDILIISVEFAPRNEVLDWAKKLCDNSKYENHKVFLLTHSYLDTNGKVIEKESYKVEPSNYGKAIWEKLVYPSENLKMVVCGHAATGNGEFSTNVSFRSDKNAEGKNVAQMMFNAQTAGGGWHGNGGDGWLRIMEFMPDGKTIRIKTFSPFFALSPSTVQLAWRTEKYDQFDITIE